MSELKTKINKDFNALIFSFHSVWIDIWFEMCAWAEIFHTEKANNEINAPLTQNSRNNSANWN